MRLVLDLWSLVLGLLTLVAGLDPTRPPEENATSFMEHVTPEGTQSTWDGDIPAINQGLIPEESPESSFLVEGDIIKARPFQLFSAANFKWPKKNGIVEIPYIFSSKYDQPSQEVILKAFADFEHLTCIRFVPRTKQKDFVSIIPMSGCFSSVGHSGGMQVTSLAPFCLQKGKGIVLHELMHVLGFWHEHSRADRDRYIHVSWKEIRPGFEINFIKSQNTNMLVPYDYTSVMHYGRYAFSKNGNTTIVPLAGPDIPIGQRWNLSTSDIIRVNRLYECSQTMKDPGFHSENNWSHQNMGVMDFIVPDEMKLSPTESSLETDSSLKAVSHPEAGNRVSPGGSDSAYSGFPGAKKVAKNIWPTWITSESSPEAAPLPDLVSPSKEVPQESMKNTSISLNNTETTQLLNEPVSGTSVHLLKILPRGTMASFPESKHLPEIHNSILEEMGEAGGLSSTPVPGRGAWPEGTVLLPSGNASFSLEFQSPSPDWKARLRNIVADIHASHPRFGSIPGQPHGCQLCGQKEIDWASTAVDVALPSGEEGLLWRLLKALTMVSASRNLPTIRARGPGTRNQVFAAELNGNNAPSKTMGTVFPARGTHNQEAPEELAQTLGGRKEEGRTEADSKKREKLLKLLAFGDATSVPYVPARHKPSPSIGQSSTWPRWRSRPRNQLSQEKAILQQPRRDNSSGGHVATDLSGVFSPFSRSNLGWALSRSLSPRGGIPALRRVPWAGSGNPVTGNLGVAGNFREEFGSAPYALPVEKAPFISPEKKLPSLENQATEGEWGLLSTLPRTISQTPSSPMAPSLLLKPQTNKILAQIKSSLLAASTQTSYLTHPMEDMTSNHFIFPVPSRKKQYLGTETPDETFQRSVGAHSEVKTTTVDGKEVRQAASPSTVGSAFPEREVASPAVSINSIWSLEDSGNQKPHPPGRIKQGGLRVAGKKWISSFAPLRRCPSGGIQLFLGGLMIPLLPVEPERIPREYKSKGTLTLLALGVERKVPSFLSWISNSSNVTLGHLMSPPQFLEDPQSQTFFLAEAKSEIPRHQRVLDPKFAEAGIVLLKSPSGLLSLVPLWECWSLSKVRESAYFPEPEALERKYRSALVENPSSAMEAMDLPSQALKTQTPFLDLLHEDKGKGQFGIRSVPLIQTKAGMAHSVKDEVTQILEEENRTSKGLGGRDPKLSPLRLGFHGDILPSSKPSWRPNTFQGISDVKSLLGLETQTSKWARGTLSLLATSRRGTESVRGTWTTTLHGEPKLNEELPQGRFKIQAGPRLPSLSLPEPVMEPQVTDIPFLWEPHTKKGRGERKPHSLSPSKAGHGNMPLTDYNSGEPFSENILHHHMAWVGRQGVQGRSSAAEEHSSQFLSHGSLPTVGREAVSKSLTTLRGEREAEEVTNRVGKSRNLAVSSAVNSEKTKSALSWFHFVNLSFPLERLDQSLTSRKTWSRVPGSQGEKGELASFPSVGITSSLGITSKFNTKSFPPSSPPFFSFLPLSQHLAFTKIAKLSTAASVGRQATTQGSKQDFPFQKSDLVQGLGKANIDKPQTPQQLWSCDQAEQGRGCAQKQGGPDSGEPSGNFSPQGPVLGSLPLAGWSEPGSLVKLRAQRQNYELQVPAGHSWLCLDGDCLKVILQDLVSSQDLGTTSVESLLARVLSFRLKPLQMGVAGTVPTKEEQMGLGSLQLPPHAESFHPDGSTQSPIMGPHAMDKLSWTPAPPQNRIDSWLSDWFCDFETDLCGWQQNGTGADWVLAQDQNSYSWSGSLPLDSPCHFPGGNHLSLQNQASSQIIPKAVLISPVLYGARWIRFWYSPLQPGMGTISVYVYSRAQFGWHLLWSSVGHRNASWSWVELKLWPSRKIQVMVEGVQGPEDGAHVSIDNLSVSSHQWPKGETKLLCHSFQDSLNKT